MKSITKEEIAVAASKLPDFDESDTPINRVPILRGSLIKDEKTVPSSVDSITAIFLKNYRNRQWEFDGVE